LTAVFLSNRLPAAASLREFFHLAIDGSPPGKMVVCQPKMQKSLFSADSRKEATQIHGVTRVFGLFPRQGESNSLCHMAPAVFGF
jgi:hypothetical protein